MIDISDITRIITAFRAETQKDSITPESLGAILQRIVNLVGMAAVETDVHTLRVQLESVAQSVIEEAEARKFADVVLNGNLSLKVDQSMLSAEIIARQNADAALAARIDQKADRSALNNEITARREYDSYLLSLHSSSSSGSTKPPVEDIGGSENPPTGGSSGGDTPSGGGSSSVGGTTPGGNSGVDTGPSIPDYVYSDDIIIQ